MDDKHDLLQATIATQIAPDARIANVQQRDGAQGQNEQTPRHLVTVRHVGYKFVE